MKKVFIALFTTLILIVTVSLAGISCGIKEIRDKKYVNNKIYPKFSLKYICPKTFDENKVIDFALCSAPLDDTQYYVQVQYTKQEYDEEIKRLSNVKGEKWFEMNSLFYDESCTFFNYPTYISTYYMGSCYVYACLEEERCVITYVYTLQEDIADIMFDVKYLPKNYTLLEQWGNDFDTRLQFCMEQDWEDNIEHWYNKLEHWYNKFDLYA